MNRVIILLLALIVGANVWLLARQQRQERQLEGLRAENIRLSEELAQRPSLSAEEFKAVSRRLENAGAFMDAVEGRLTNAASLLGQLQSASRSFTTRQPRRAEFNNVLEGGRRPIQMDLTSPSDHSERAFGGPACSHGPDGQMFQRSWGPEQVVGPPNTHQAGDISTAGAPLSSQGGRGEWLHVNYDQAVDISEVRVRETYNPGAIEKLAAVLASGEEVVIWEGVTTPGQAPMDTSFSIPAGVQAKSVKVYLDRTRAPGWNEIDAVELIGRDGTRQWASSATASTSFAVRSPLFKVGEHPMAMECPCTQNGLHEYA